MEYLYECPKLAVTHDKGDCCVVDSLEAEVERLKVLVKALERELSREKTISNRMTSKSGGLKNHNNKLKAQAERYRKGLRLPRR